VGGLMMWWWNTGTLEHWNTGTLEHWNVSIGDDEGDTEQ
jgi:hypothetical protein